MTAHSGRKCAALLRKPSQAGCLVKMLLESSTWNSTACLLTWKVSATPHGRLCFRLVPQTPDTDEIESGLWATPTANDSKNSAYQYSRGDHSKPVLKLTGQARLWPTPRAADGTKGIRTAEGTAKERLRRKNGQDLPTTIGGRLNPEWVEWLMGYPTGHTESKDSATPSCRKSRKH